MTQEDKKLLLKDICARLAYGLMLRIGGHDVKITTNNTWIYFGASDESQEHIKPYLRPMSSMTEEEVSEFESITDEFLEDGTSEEIWNTVIDWLNVHHFDHRHLIEKGLALIAPEGMYK